MTGCRDLLALAIEFKGKLVDVKFSEHVVLLLKIKKLEGHLVEPSGTAASALLNTNGSRETSHAAGSLLVILSDRYEKLKEQVSQNALSVSSGSGCLTMAADLKRIIAAQKQTANINKLSSCDPKRLDECAAYQAFKAENEVIRSAYMLINRCLLVEDTAREYRGFKISILADIKLNAMDTCAKNFADDAAMNQCYATKYEQWIKSTLKSKYPQAANGC